MTYTNIRVILAYKGQLQLTNMEEKIYYDPYEFNFSYRQYSVESLFNQNQLILGECKWSNKKCSLFIESILIRIPLEFFYLDRTLGHYRVISGSNRLHAIKRVVFESYKLQGLEFLTELNGLTFQQISRKYQRRVLEANLNVHIMEPGTPLYIVKNISKRIK